MTWLPQSGFGEKLKLASDKNFSLRNEIVTRFVVSLLLEMYYILILALTIQYALSWEVHLSPNNDNIPEQPLLNTIDKNYQPNISF